MTKRTTLPSWDVSDEDAHLICLIVERALQSIAPLKVETSADRLSLTMALTSCHANGCPLRLRELYDARTHDFLHDVFGIHRHIDHLTGRLTECFMPRYAAPIPGASQVIRTPFISL